MILVTSQNLMAALHALTKTSEQVERIEIVDFEDSHITTTPGGFAWHTKREIQSFRVDDAPQKCGCHAGPSAASRCIAAVLAGVSETAHFRQIKYA